MFGVDMKIVDPDGNDLPWDGVAFGDLLVRGPWIVNTLFARRRWRPARARCGRPDLVSRPAMSRRSIADGYLQITDRSKDVIKSGGEWISSIDIENVAMSHPGDRDVRVHRRRASQVGRASAAGGRAQGRRDGQRDELLRHYDGKVAKWQVPDDVAFVDAIPLGATGKMLKNKLREQFRDYRLPTA